MHMALMACHMKWKDSKTWWCGRAEAHGSCLAAFKKTPAQPQFSESNLHIRPQISKHT